MDAVIELLGGQPLIRGVGGGSMRPAIWFGASEKRLQNGPGTSLYVEIAINDLNIASIDTP